MIEIVAIWSLICWFMTSVLFALFLYMPDVRPWDRWGEAPILMVEIWWIFFLAPVRLLIQLVPPRKV